MKDNKESKIRLALVIIILILIVIAYFYLKQNKDILKDEVESGSVMITTQIESVISTSYVEEKTTMNEMETAPGDISDWEMHKPANTELDTGETILVQ